MYNLQLNMTIKKKETKTGAGGSGGGDTQEPWTPETQLSLCLRTACGFLQRTSQNFPPATSKPPALGSPVPGAFSKSHLCSPSAWGASGGHQRLFVARFTKFPSCHLPDLLQVQTTNAVGFREAGIC